MTYHIVSIILAIVSGLIVLLVGFLSSILREEYRPKKPYAPFSFSRAQLWLWTLIIIPLFVLNWGFNHPGAPTINETSLVLLSISGALTLTSTVITQVHVAAKKSTKLSKDSKGFFFDILVDDTGQFSVGRLQNFVFTLVFAVVYIVYFFKSKFEYINFEPFVYVLMGISSGAYLFGKAMQK